MLNSAPLISIITPVFNGEHYIAACIENVIAQGFDQVEHLIVDGGSTDNTVAIIQDHAARYPHIRWMSEKDRGQSDAMNKGIGMARGEFISFLNADDFYEKGAFVRIGQLVTSFRSGERENLFFLANCRVVDEKGNFLFLNRPGKLHYSLMLTGMHIEGNPINPAAYFYHKSLHDQVGPYRVEEHNHMDLEFILRVMPIATVRYFDEIWGNFRWYEGTKTAAGAQAGVLIDNVRTILRAFHPSLRWHQKLFVLPVFRFLGSRFYRRLAFIYEWFYGRVKFTALQPRRAARRLQERLQQGLYAALRLIKGLRTRS